MVYKLGTIGQEAAPTDADSWAVKGVSATILKRKRERMYFKRLFFSPQSDKMSVNIRLPRRFLRDGEKVGILLEDRQTSISHTLSYQLYGWVKSAQR